MEYLIISNEIYLFMARKIMKVSSLVVLDIYLPVPIPISHIIHWYIYLVVYAVKMKKASKVDKKWHIFFFNIAIDGLLHISVVYQSSSFFNTTDDGSVNHQKKKFLPLLVLHCN